MDENLVFTYILKPQPHISRFLLHRFDQKLGNVIETVFLNNGSNFFWTKNCFTEKTLNLNWLK